MVPLLRHLNSVCQLKSVWVCEELLQRLKPVGYDFHFGCHSWKPVLYSFLPPAIALFFFSFPSSNSKEINRLDQPLAVYRFIKLIYALWSLLVLSLLHFLFHWHVGTLKLIKWCHKLMDLIDRLGWAVSLGKWRGSLFHSCYCSKCWLSMPHVHYVVPSSFRKSVLIFFVTEIGLNWKRYGHESLVTNVITRRLTWRKGL